MSKKHLDFFFLVIIFCVSTIQASAQDNELENATISYGDTVFFGPCSGTHFEYMDYHVKTRFSEEQKSFEDIDGPQFYNEYFLTGDFDASRMPCELSGKFGIVKHISATEETEDQPFSAIIIVMIEDGKTTGNIIPQAFESGEAILVPKK